MTSSPHTMSNMSVDEQGRQISASYFISSNNRSFIRNRHFAVYEPISHRLPMRMEAQQEPEPEEQFQDEKGNTISPVSQGQVSRFFDTEDESDNSEEIIGNSDHRSESNMEISHSTTPQKTQYEPQHHLIVETAPSFEFYSSNSSHTDGNDSLSIDEAKQVRRFPPSIPSLNGNICSPIMSSTRSDYLTQLQAQISSLQRDVHGMQESILLLTRNLQKGKVERIRNTMISNFSMDANSLSSLDTTDALIYDCLNSISDEESESRKSTSHSQVMKSLDRKMVQRRERKSAIRNRFQQRQRRGRRVQQSRSTSITPLTTPSGEDLSTPLASNQTPSPFSGNDGDEHVKRTLFLAGHTPCAEMTKRDGEDRRRDDVINRILLVLVFLATAAVLLTTDASIQSNGKPRGQTEIVCYHHSCRSRLARKKLTIDEQSNSCDKSGKGSLPHYNPKQPQFVQDLLVWRSYREGKARLEPWKAIVLSLRERSSDPSSETCKSLVSEYTFWL